jgi:hypothetical protein
MAIPLRLTLIVALSIGLAGCGQSSGPAAPSAPSLTGTWVGTGLFLPGDTLTFTMSQSGSSLTGPWTEGQGGPRGTLTGTANGSNVSITFNLTDSNSCPFPVQITGTVTGSRISGAYNTVPGFCVGSSFTSNGTGAWTRQ